MPEYLKIPTLLPMVDGVIGGITGTTVAGLSAIRTFGKTVFVSASWEVTSQINIGTNFGKLVNLLGTSGASQYLLGCFVNPNNSYDNNTITIAFNPSTGFFSLYKVGTGNFTHIVPGNVIWINSAIISIE